MRKQIVFSAACILAIPLLFSTYQSKSVPNPIPYATVAFAGHTTAGTWCECGTPGCTCDPGEDPGIRSVKPVTDNPKASHQGLSPVRTQSRTGFDFGTGTLLLALALLLWARLRG